MMVKSEQSVEKRKLRRTAKQNNNYIIITAYHLSILSLEGAILGCFEQHLNDAGSDSFPEKLEDDSGNYKINPTMEFLTSKI